MKIYAYTQNNNQHWTPASEFISIGNMGGIHYFAIEDSVSIPSQPAGIEWHEVTDAAELASVEKSCPHLSSFEGAARTAEAVRVGLRAE